LAALPALSGLAELKSLDLSECSGVTDMTPLTHLKQLDSLQLPPTLTNEQLKWLRDQGVFDNLELLTVSQCEHLTDVAFLVGLTNLRELRLQACRRLLDVSPLADAGLTGLRLLSLNLCDNVTVVALSDFPQLHTLQLECRYLRTVSLSGMPNLTSLSLDWCEELDQGVAQLQKQFPRCKISHYTP
jgi:hypothetical protein